VGIGQGPADGRGADLGRIGQVMLLDERLGSLQILLEALQVLLVELRDLLPLSHKFVHALFQEVVLADGIRLHQGGADVLLGAEPQHLLAGFAGQEVVRQQHDVIAAVLGRGAEHRLHGVLRVLGPAHAVMGDADEPELAVRLHPGGHGVERLVPDQLELLRHVVHHAVDVVGLQLLEALAETVGEVFNRVLLLELQLGRDEHRLPVPAPDGLGDDRLVLVAFRGVDVGDPRLQHHPDHRLGEAGAQADVRHLEPGAAQRPVLPDLRIRGCRRRFLRRQQTAGGQEPGAHHPGHAALDEPTPIQSFLIPHVALQ